VRNYVQSAKALAKIDLVLGIIVFGEFLGEDAIRAMMPHQTNQLFEGRDQS
jgi:hypothetical protein